MRPIAPSALLRLAGALAGREPASRACSQSRPFVSAAAPQLLLYRDFIQQSLYHPVLGYFNKPAPPVARLRQPIPFNRIVNQAEYNLVLSRAYKELQVDWLTPVEVFAPWYGRALARYMLEARQHTLRCTAEPLAIVEVGGGTGTLAASILDYIAEKEPVTYSCMSYTTVEISPRLADLQQQLVAGERRHAQAWRCVRADASTAGAWRQVAEGLPAAHSLQQQHCFVLMMEVLDNLPHDRVVRTSPDAPWQQVAVEVPAAAAGCSNSSSSSSSSGGTSEATAALAADMQEATGFREVLQPAEDPLLRRCLAAAWPEEQQLQDGRAERQLEGRSRGSGGGSVKSWLRQVLGLPGTGAPPTDVWLPTRCLALLELLHAAAPRHTLVAGDFDALPDVAVPGANAPLVSGRPAPGLAKDYGSVLVPWGSADIFFPTDFDALGRLYAAAAKAGPVLRADAAAAVAAASQRRRQRQEQPQGASGGGSGGSVSVSHSPTADFMSVFAEAKSTRLLSGYNPLVQDWPNTRVFVGSTASAAVAAA